MKWTISEDSYCRYGGMASRIGHGARDEDYGVSMERILNLDYHQC